MRPLLGNPTVPLLITEGVVKGDSAVSSLDVVTISLAGVWNWRGGNDLGGKVALPDWEYVALNDREILVVFDSDVTENPSVEAAMQRLGALLEQRGAQVRVTYLPAGDHGAKVGLDDWLVANADTERSELLRTLARLSLPLDGDRPHAPPPPAPPPRPRGLREVDATFDRWLERPDLQAVHTSCSLPPPPTGVPVIRCGCSSSRRPRRARPRR
ncbi:MAG: DUF3854 domain-containing protein [Acidimicrobiales bacterium]